ncbi:CaiB/BaiF CoA transferase family protein [Streptomyces melanosporofaciens]|uniref:Crotonobetainyl-CoA:carnitine CoA-transferase CaiB n=1 Tax=Streptomyces melanosporofaciens TaxID=67327 RepID=A0A1H5C9G5_STRMJ|nr:CaiB/BaiF CoA-transferase family protein [Streptomyces melanosporofaciens]SED63459.1 Crotonobetainyl-CoA:carnitine CoA-transferase CaiB [Streptomyces melanosporofaciens]
MKIDTSDESVGGGALHGLTVLDLSRVLAGPYCAQMLGDHGARVIKVEPPEGDMTREWGATGEERISAYYAGLNRNKEHISIDLRSTEGQDLLLELLTDADVLIENFKAGTMDRWGMGPGVLLERFPRLVYCRVTGFGYHGPMGGLPGYDAVLQAFSGIMHMNGEADGGPVKVPMPVVDLTTGMLALSGVLLALHERSRSGCGQLVDLALLDSALSLLHPQAANYFLHGEEPRRIGTAHPNVAPYETFGGPENQLFVGGGNDRQFHALCEYLGDPGLADDPRFRTNAQRVNHRLELSSRVAELMTDIDLDEAAGSMLAHGIPASPVRPLPEVMEDPQVRHRRMVQDIGDYRVLGIPVKLARTPGAVVTPPRALGADTRRTLTDLGVPPARIEELVRNGVVHASETSSAASGDGTDA